MLGNSSNSTGGSVISGAIGAAAGGVAAAITAVFGSVPPWAVATFVAVGALLGIALKIGYAHQDWADRKHRRDMANRVVNAALDENSGPARRESATEISRILLTTHPPQPPSDSNGSAPGE